MTVMTFVMCSESIEDVDFVPVPDVVVSCVTSKTLHAVAATASMMPKEGALSLVLRPALTPIAAVLLFVCHHGVFLLCLDIFNASIWRTTTPASSVSSFICDVLRTRWQRGHNPEFAGLVYKPNTP